MNETKITRLLCQGCGADLDVSDGVRFVTCNYCSAKLEVVRDSSTTHTRVLESIAGDVKVIRLQNDLEQLDREWEAKKGDFMVSNKNGHRSIPKKGESMIGGFVILTFGIFWIAMASSVSSIVGGASALLPLLGVVFVILGIFQAAKGVSKADSFELAESGYKKQRAELLNKLGDSKGNKSL